METSKHGRLSVHVNKDTPWHQDLNFAWPDTEPSSEAWRGQIHGSSTSETEQSLNQKYHHKDPALCSRGSGRRQCVIVDPLGRSDLR